MRLAFRGFAVGLVLLAGCESPAAVPVRASASATPEKAPPRPPRSPTQRTRAKPPPKPPSVRLVGLRLGSDGRYQAELAPKSEQVRVVVATKTRPLAPLGPAAHHGIARLVAPEVVGKTELRALPLREVTLAAADDRTRRALEKELRVLADGSVLAALIAMPREPPKAIDLGDMVEGRRAFVWEAKLFAREPPPEDERRLLAVYQKLLAVDYLVDNLVRRKVLVDENAGTLLAIDENDAFSARPDDRGVGEALRRLSSHVVFSVSLVARLKELERSAIERALRGPDDSLLVTPKQLDEVDERKRTLEKLIDGRVRARGKRQVLILP